MRDRYLFRGKTEISERWVVGDLVQWSGDDMCICEEYNSTEKKRYSVIPETVGQYTGLKDKNGNKIFEGDIVAGALTWLKRRKNGFVAFKDGSFGLIWYRGDIEQFNAFTSMCNIEYEVIGNIHDDPDLLKGE